MEYARFESGRWRDKIVAFLTTLVAPTHKRLLIEPVLLVAAVASARAVVAGGAAAKVLLAVGSALVDRAMAVVIGDAERRAIPHVVGFNVRAPFIIVIIAVACLS